MVNIRVVDGHLHIDGYDNARRIVRVPSDPFGRKLADLRLHEADLVFCEEAIQEFGRLLPTSSPVVLECLLIAVLTRYYGCFGRNDGRISLQKKVVFESEPVQALENFNHYKAIRDKHFVHDENPLRSMKTAAVLGANGELLDIVSLGVAAHFAGDREFAQGLYELVVHTLKDVRSRIEKTLRECREALALLPVEQLEALPNLMSELPDITKISQTRGY